MKNDSSKNNDLEGLKELLKSLPKVDAPDNFEFNLMAKIKNNNLETETSRKKGWLSWALTPAIAFAATVFLIFFFIGTEEPTENLFDSTPKIVANAQVDEAISNQPEKNSLKEDSFDKILRQNNIESQNIAQTNKNRPLPFNKNTSINLDEYLQDNNSIDQENSRSHLATSQNGNISPFEGFFLREVKKHSKTDSLNLKDSSKVGKDE